MCNLSFAQIRKTAVDAEVVVFMRSRVVMMLLVLLLMMMMMMMNELNLFILKMQKALGYELNWKAFIFRIFTTKIAVFSSLPSIIVECLSLCFTLSPIIMDVENDPK